MRYSSQVKPIRSLKANAAEVLLQLAEQRQPLIITQNGEAKAVIQDVASYEETQETFALLKLLALGSHEIEAGKVKPAADVVAATRQARCGLMRRDRYEIFLFLTQGAEQDLESIYDYVAEFHPIPNANHVLDQLLEVTESLATFPERGSHPKESYRL
jgi:prevent-host-death family protein